MVNRIKRALFSTYVLKHIILCLRTESDDLTCQVEVLVGEISAINVLCVCVCVCVWHVCVCVWRGSALVCVWCVCGGGGVRWCVHMKRGVQHHTHLESSAITTRLVLTVKTAKHWLIFSASLGRQCWDRDMT